MRALKKISVDETMSVLVYKYSTSLCVFLFSSVWNRNSVLSKHWGRRKYGMADIYAINSRENVIVSQVYLLSANWIDVIWIAVLKSLFTTCVLWISASMKTAEAESGRSRTSDFMWDLRVDLIDSPSLPEATPSSFSLSEGTSSSFFVGSPSPRFCRFFSKISSMIVTIEIA